MKKVASSLKIHIKQHSCLKRSQCYSFKNKITSQKLLDPVFSTRNVNPKMLNHMFDNNTFTLINDDGQLRPFVIDSIEQLIYLLNYL